MRLRPFTAMGVCALTLLLMVAAAPVSAQITINEIRIDQTGTDVDEYFELKGPPGTPLTGLTYVVIGDQGSVGTCGYLEAALDLSPYSIQADGLIALVDGDGVPTLTGYDVFLPAGSLNFENGDNVTHMLVTGYVGTVGTDLDTNDDGVLDITPWSAVIDCVGLDEGTVPNCTTDEFLYCATTVGPDGSFVPGHVYICSDIPGQWEIGIFDPSVGVDTPGSPNPGCLSPPPNFVDENRDPCVPLTTETAAITATVLNATSATYVYSVNGGAQIGPAAMAVQSTSGDTTVFAATLPLQPVNGTLVEYRVTAYNANPDTSLGFQQGYFVGTVNVEDIRVNDASGANIYEFYGARVTGNVTVPFGVYASVRTDGYIQDATGGINIFDFDINPVFQSATLGDQLTVSGAIDQFNGKLELTEVGSCDTLIIELDGPGAVPAPMQITPCQLGEGVEGMLVSMVYAEIDTTGSGGVFGATNVSYDIDNCTGNTGLDVFIDADTNIPGNPIVSTTYVVTGIATQFGGLLTGYDLSPRYITDLVPFTVGVGDRIETPTMRLMQNRPNPFSRNTQIAYQVPQSGAAGETVPVRLDVFDIQGRRVATLVDAPQAPGDYSVTLESGDLGSAGPGVYFYRLEVGDRTLTRKLILQ